MTIFSLVISGIALLVSIFTFFTNQAKHNLQQLQTRYQIFCDKFKELILFGNYKQLTDFKYDLENIVVYVEKETQGSIEYNNLQKTVGKSIESCKMAYIDLVENLDFFDTKRNLTIKDHKEPFVSWFNDTINQYYAKLNEHYATLYEINFITRAAQYGIIKPNAFATIKHFYQNIKDIVNMSEVLLFLKREMSGVFGKLSVTDVDFFRNNTVAIKHIEKYIHKFIYEYGIDDVINKGNYEKISVVYKNFNGETFSEHLAEEEKDFCTFIKMLAKNNSTSKVSLQTK